MMNSEMIRYSLKRFIICNVFCLMIAITFTLSLPSFRPHSGVKVNLVSLFSRRIEFKFVKIK